MPQFDLKLFAVRFLVKSLNQTIGIGVDKLEHPLYKWLTMPPNQF